MYKLKELLMYENRKRLYAEETLNDCNTAFHACFLHHPKKIFFWLRNKCCEHQLKPENKARSRPLTTVNNRKF
jgi:hypothetical protein